MTAMNQDTELVFINSSLPRIAGPVARVTKRRNDYYMLPQSPTSPTSHGRMQVAPISGSAAARRKNDYILKHVAKKSLRGTSEFHGFNLNSPNCRGDQTVELGGYGAGRRRTQESAYYSVLINENIQAILNFNQIDIFGLLPVFMHARQSSQKTKAFYIPLVNDWHTEHTDQYTPIILYLSMMNGVFEDPERSAEFLNLRLVLSGVLVSAVNSSGSLGKADSGISIERLILNLANPSSYSYKSKYKASMLALGLSESLRWAAPTNQPNINVETNQNEAYRLQSLPRSPCPLSSDSGSGSVKSFKSSTNLHCRSSSLNRDTYSLQLFSAPPKSSHSYDIDTNLNPLRPPSRSKDGPDLRRAAIRDLKSYANKGSASSVNNINSTVCSLRNLPNPPGSRPISSKSSSGSFKSARDRMKRRTTNTKTSESPPSPTSSEYFFTHNSGEHLLAPQPRSPSLNGCVEAYFQPNFTMLPVPASSQMLPRVSSYIPMCTPSIQLLPGTVRRKNQILLSPPPGLVLSEPGADSFETTLASPNSSPYSFKTALTSLELGSGSFTHAIESSRNMLEPRDGNVDAHRSATRSLNSTLKNDVPPSLPLPQQSIINGEMDVSDSQSPHRSKSLFSPPDLRKSSPPKGPVHDGSLLTPAIHVAVNEAAALYDSIRWDGLLSLSEISSNPFSRYSPQTLARQYAVVIDARNALLLRQAAIVADIGLYLQLLTLKVNLYATDKANLASIHRDLEYIREECVRQKVKLPFGDLEWSRSAKHPSGLAFVHDDRHQDFCWQEITMLLHTYSDARAVGFQFLDDPASLIENRLPKLRSHR
ncbi:hypothetical protein HYPSUDRAFT_55385 [Hypholoma sublateritium FD-334 SS-4]|uniref:Uncharacterized protein n=1 Tax=Hypholoma sublateritium (strain FD-334 SS-4) TaxID=945553 RepID=A0A0D2NZ36_HYPSF|nr:hypothetical protein HYPSUDRAFT_55385 [Hypholoma sublateritium FD-334 SS-4]